MAFNKKAVMLCVAMREADGHYANLKMSDRRISKYHKISLIH